MKSNRLIVCCYDEPDALIKLHELLQEQRTNSEDITTASWNDHAVQSYERKPEFLKYKYIQRHIYK